MVKLNNCKVEIWRVIYISFQIVYFFVTVFNPKVVSMNETTIFTKIPRFFFSSRDMVFVTFKIQCTNKFKCEGVPNAKSSLKNISLYSLWKEYTEYLTDIKGIGYTHARLYTRKLLS